LSYKIYTRATPGAKGVLQHEAPEWDADFEKAKEHFVNNNYRVGIFEGDDDNPLIYTNLKYADEDERDEKRKFLATFGQVQASA